MVQDAIGLRCPTCGCSAMAATVLDDDGPVGTALCQCPIDGTVYRARWKPATARDLRLSEQAALARETERAAVREGRHGLARLMHATAARLDAMAGRRARQAARWEVASR